MGSSPVTATISPRPPPFVAALRRALRDAGGTAPGDLLLVAFSGGPDSTALLLGLRRLAPRLGCRLLAAHVDHRLDPGSPARATAAERLALGLGVPFRLLVAAPPAAGARVASSDGPEAGARRRRYALLEELRRSTSARYLLTAHHAGDQAETVLLRLAHGSGLAGLAGIRPRQGTLLRPLLAHGRDELAAAVTAAGLVPVDDPTNRDLEVPRNRLRHGLLPALGGDTAARQAIAVGDAAATLSGGLERRLVSLVPGLVAPSPRLPLAVLRDLPCEILPWALALLHRHAGAAYPPRAAAVAELRGQLARGDALACDCGGGWRWWTDGAGDLRLDRTGARAEGSPAPASAGSPGPLPAPAARTPFAYTVDVPGGVEIREAGTTFCLSRQPVAAWMRRGSLQRAALDLPLAPGGEVTVRNRRPGDRLQPFGCPHRRRLKDVLIDHKVPRERRDRLPLLCVAGQVAWVPGVTIHHPFRLREGATVAWVAELLAHRDQG